MRSPRSDASRPGFLAGSKAPGRRLLEAVSKGLKTAHAWPRLAALAETIRAALAEAPEMGAEAARAKEAAEAIERLSGADAEPAGEKRRRRRFLSLPLALRCASACR